MHPARVSRFLLPCIICLASAARADDYDGVLVKPFFTVPMLSLEVQGSGADDHAEFEPNVSPDVGVRVEIYGLGFAVSRPLSNRDEDSVRTTYYDYKADYTAQYWGIEGGAHSYRGLANSDRDDGDASLDAQRPDLKKVGRYVNIYGFLRGTELSYGDSLLSSRRKDEPEGKHWSPVGQLGYDYTDLSGNEPIAAHQDLNLSGDAASIESARYGSTILSLGVAGRTSAYKNRLIGMLLMGRSVETYDYRLADGRHRSGQSYGSRLSLRMGMERALTDWVFGLTLMMDETTMPFGDAEIQSQVGVLTLSLARIFGAPQA